MSAGALAGNRSDKCFFEHPTRAQIPAGIVRMNFGLFSLMTIAGSTIWCYFLAYLGHRAYLVEPELLTNPEAMVHFIRGQSGGILLVVTLFAALYMLTLRLMKPRSGA